MKKVNKDKIIFIVCLMVLIAMIGITYIHYLSEEMTEWGEHETITCNRPVRKERPQSGGISFLYNDYDDDFHRYIRIYGSLELFEIDGVCTLEIFEGDEKKYSIQYENGIYDIDYEWESFPGDGQTKVILSTDGTVYDAEFNYALYSRSSKLNYFLSRIKRRMGII